jgi:DNA-binding transcriptional LysR family regulator
MPTPGSRVTLRQLEYALAVADTGTMSGAAERLNLSQSAVSLAVADVEKALGIQLFLRRKAKGVSLTDVGRDILPEIRSLLAQADDLHSMARSLGETIEGTLMLGCYPTLTPFLMPRILGGFPQLHPSVGIDLFEGSVDAMQQRLLEGRCEVALMYDTGIVPDVAMTRLYTLRPCVILPADHRLARQTDPISLADLRDEPMVMPDMPPSEGMFRDVLSSAGVEPRVRFRTTTSEAVRSMVACGAGYSLVLHRHTPPTTYAGLPLSHREIADDVRSVNVVLAQARTARLTRRARAFTDFCRQVLSPDEPAVGPRPGAEGAAGRSSTGAGRPEGER